MPTVPTVPTVTTQLQPSTQPDRSFQSVSECLFVVELAPHSLFFQTISDNFLDGITLELSPRDDPFSEEMELGTSPNPEEEAPGSPGSQAQRDLENHS